MLDSAAAGVALADVAGAAAFEQPKKLARETATLVMRLFKTIPAKAAILGPIMRI